MPQATVRLRLPSGGWWEIQTRPLWKHVRQWSANGAGPDVASQAIDLALVSLTTAWSFEEEVSLEAMGRRDVDDLVAAHLAFQREVLASFQAESPRDMAQRLLAGLATGRVPPTFAEAHLMASTGWTWQTLQETPADVVQKMWIYQAVAQARSTQGTLEFSDTEDS